MNHLLRDIAPLTPDAWSFLDQESRRALEPNLAARQLVELQGPHGWTFSTISTGRVESLAATPREGVRVRRRHVLPLIELEAQFELDRRQLEALGRGAEDVDLSALVTAAEHIAHAEDRAVFHGFAEGGIVGLVEASPHAPLVISEEYTNYPATVVGAVERLHSFNVAGPYGIALGPRCYEGLLTASDSNGFPVLSRLQKILDGPIVRAPALDGALVVSLRGGDFELTLGSDLSLGYRSHDSRSVQLYMVESLIFRNLDPVAAVPLIYEA